MNRLRQEAFWLEGRLIAALFTETDPARYDRLKRLRERAERRYWRRHEQTYPPGNQTPSWFYRTAKGGY